MILWNIFGSFLEEWRFSRRLVFKRDGVFQVPTVRSLRAGSMKVHPGKLTWNLKMNPWKRRFLIKTIIFRFHVSFRGGIHSVIIELVKSLNIESPF